MIKVLVFSAQWCNACQPYKQMLKEANIDFTEVDVEQQMELASEHNIKSLPTTLIIKDGEVIQRFSQAVGAEVIKKFL